MKVRKFLKRMGILAGLFVAGAGIALTLGTRRVNRLFEVEIIADLGPDFEESEDRILA
jgi:hypothetical protein